MPRVLLIDDPSDPRHGIASILRDAGYDVEITDDGRAGLERARGWGPDVILLDVHAAGLGGFEAVERLKHDAETEPVPVVLLTSEAPSDELIVRGLQAGAFDFLSRRCSAAELLARVGVMARIKRAHDDLAAFARISDALLQTLDPVAMSELFVEQAREIFRADAVLLAMPSEEGLAARVGTGLDPERPEWTRVLDELFAEDAGIPRGGPVSADELSPDVARFLHERSFRCVIGAQVRPDDEPTRIVVLSGREGTFGRDSDRRLLASLARQGRIALDNALLHSTKRRHAEELERAMQLRSRFFAAMSHELRTPINALIGYNELLRGGVFGELTDRQRGAVENVERAASHLLALINDVLDISKIEAGKLEVATEEADLAELLLDTINTCRPIAEEKGLAIEVTAPDRLPMVTDPQRVRQILLNLASNAVKFTEEGRVSIEVKQFEEGGLPMVCIVVADTGPGVPDEHRERIFEEFEQVPGDVSHGGTGLGLSISRRLATLLRGRLELEPSSGAGAVFTVTLPLELSLGGAETELRLV